MKGRPLVLALFASINNNKPASSILIGDFNAICPKLCRSSKNNIAGLETSNITTTVGHSKVINKVIFSCLDLIFSSNMSFIRNYGTEQFIFNDYHHNIIYGTLDFNVPLPSPYATEIWDYKNADAGSIKKQFQMFVGLKHFGARLQMKTVKY